MSDLEDLDFILEVAGCYRALLNQDLFEEETTASEYVQTAVRNYIQGQLSTILKGSSGKSEDKPVDAGGSAFTSDELYALKALAGHTLASVKDDSPPKTNPQSPPKAVVDPLVKAKTKATPKKEVTPPVPAPVPVEEYEEQDTLFEYWGADQISQDPTAGLTPIQEEPEVCNTPIPPVVSKPKEVLPTPAPAVKVPAKSITQKVGGKAPPSKTKELPKKRRIRTMGTEKSTPKPQAPPQPIPPIQLIHSVQQAQQAQQVQQAQQIPFVQPQTQQPQPVMPVPVPGQPIDNMPPILPAPKARGGQLAVESMVHSTRSIDKSQKHWNDRSNPFNNLF